MENTVRIRPHRTDSRQDSVFVLSYVMEIILGIDPKGRPQQDVHACTNR